MFKVVDPSSQIAPRITWAIFCILVGCLAMHFLLEDSVLVPDMAAMDLVAAGENPQIFDETEHKDDLVIPAGQLARISACEVQLAPGCNEKHEKLVNSPALPPPKI